MGDWYNRLLEVWPCPPLSLLSPRQLQQWQAGNFPIGPCISHYICFRSMYQCWLTVVCSRLNFLISRSLWQWYINAIIGVLYIIHRPVFDLKHCFGDWTPPPSSGESLLSWAHLVELVPISGHQNQHKTGYINQTQHKPLEAVKTDITNLCMHEALHLWPFIM
jgi:hypothetical protein